MLPYTITISSFPNGTQSNPIICSGYIDAAGRTSSEIYKLVLDMAITKMLEQNPNSAYGTYIVDDYQIGRVAMRK